MIDNNSIREIMTSDIIVVHENQNLSDVTSIFRENDIHHVPVLKGKKPVGIISTHDIFKLIFDTGHTDERMLDALLDHTYELNEVMTDKLVVLDDSATIKDATKILSDSSMHSILIVDKKGDLSGIVTTTDLVRFLHSNIES